MNNYLMAHYLRLALCVKSVVRRYKAGSFIKKIILSIVLLNAGVAFADAPEFAPIANQTLTINETASPSPRGAALSLTGSDFGLSVSATSSNPSLIRMNASQPPINIRAVLYELMPNMFGSAIITVTVSGGQWSQMQQFTVTVPAPSPGVQPPVLAPLENRKLDISSSEQTIVVNYSVTDRDTPLAGLTVSATSSNPNLLSAAFGPPPSVQQVKAFSVRPNSSGSTIVTFTASDGQSTSSQTFKVTVGPSVPNNLPTISSISNQSLASNTNSVTVPFSVSDLDIPAAALTVSVTSSNTNLLPVSGIFLAGSGANRSVTLSPNRNLMGESVITLTVSDGEDTSSTSFKVTVASNGTFNALIVHDDATLSAADFSLRAVLNLLGSQSGSNADSLFKDIWQAQQCPGDGSFNGFPYECRLFESTQTSADIDLYRPVALVNRFDLRDKVSFNNCGEARIVYQFIDGSRGAGFIIFEAQLPNPQPGVEAGCLPIVNFWKNLPAKTNVTERAAQLRGFFFTGVPTSSVGAVINKNNYQIGTGQIRTNMLMDFAKGWVLREFKLSGNKIVRVTDKSNPFGLLFNDGNTDPRAIAFKKDFVENLPSLLLNTDDFFLSVSNDAHNNGQSHSEVGIFENQYGLHLGAQHSAFRNELDSKLAGTGLTTDQVINRAVAMTCGGCHQPSAFGLTSSNSIGPGQSWPSTLGFTHINQDQSTKVISLSPALKSVFLPARERDISTFLAKPTHQTSKRISAPTATPVITGKRSG